MAHWHYLETAAFKSRQILAAGYLSDCPTIIELGGYKTPVTEFLTHPFKQAVSIDPLTVEKEDKNILHIAKDYREVDFSPFTKEDYGFVMLGMDLPFSQKLFELIQHAKKVVLEFTPYHTPSVELFNEIMLRTSLKQIAYLNIDLSNNDYHHLKDSFKVFPFRSMYILQNVLK